MAILKINGIEMPAPAAVTFSFSALDSYAERNNAGKLNRRIIAKKKKYEVSWERIPDCDDYKTVYNTLAGLGEFATFTIYEPGSDVPISFEGYIGDISTGLYFVKATGTTEKAYWDMLKVSIIER